VVADGAAAAAAAVVARAADAAVLDLGVAVAAAAAAAAGAMKVVESLSEVLHACGCSSLANELVTKFG
jgi:hypothetical protein